MVSFTQLPLELLSHIHQLSTEGDNPREQQRARFSFALIARACFLATADSTVFHVEGDEQAKALLSKLEREKRWVAQEDVKARSGRTTRASLKIARVSHIRRLSCVFSYFDSGKDLGALLSATPNLVVLDLEVGQFGEMSAASDDDCQWALPFEGITRGLAGLQELHFHTFDIDVEAFVRFVTPHS